MQRIIPQIYVENCARALEFYQKIFGGELRNVQTADGHEMFKGHTGQIIHSELHIDDDCVLYFYSGEGRSEGPVQLLLQLSTLKEIGLIYDALGDEGTVKVKLDKQFWGDYHGVVTDKYGVTWALNYTERPQNVEE